MSRRLVIAIAALILAAGACSTGSGTEAATTSTTPAAPTTTTSTSTSQTTTTTVPPTSSTTTSVASEPGRFVVLDPSIFPADPLPGSDGASGSGCAPGAGDLPGGVWYGTIVSAEPGSIEFDLACFYFGEIAWEVAAAVGEEANNDYWIINDNPALRTVPVAAKAVVWSIPADLSDLVPLSYLTEWPPDWQRAYAACPGEFCGVWLYVNHGVVDEIVEQYVP